MKRQTFTLPTSQSCWLFRNRFAQQNGSRDSFGGFRISKSFVESKNLAFKIFFNPEEVKDVGGFRSKNQSWGSSGMYGMLMLTVVRIKLSVVALLPRILVSDFHQVRHQIFNSKYEKSCSDGWNYRENVLFAQVVVLKQLKPRWARVRKCRDLKTVFVKAQEHRSWGSVV